MTQQDKELLLKDLCARLPYGVIITDGHIDIKLGPYISTAVFVDSSWKPYLRPMLSMTEDEVRELVKIRHGRFYGDTILGINGISLHDESTWSAWVRYERGGATYTKCEIVGRVNFETTIEEIDWLYAHHFDYRGLIEKGLAIEVTEYNNPYKK